MTYTAIQNPLPVYNDTKGVPISGGRVFIGASGSDPEATPQAVYWDAAGTLPAAQPLQLKGGYIVNGSSPAQIFTTIPLSIRVYDNLGNVVWYKSTVTQLDQSALDAAAASIIASGTATINAAATTAAASASAASAASATAAQTAASFAEFIAGSNSAYLGPVATRCNFPDTYLHDNSTVTGFNTGTVHYATEDLTSIKLAYANAFVNNGSGGGDMTELSTPLSNLVIAVGIEYPIGTTTTRLTFGGANSGNLNKGSILYSDWLTIAIPKGAKFRVRTYWTVQGGGQVFVPSNYFGGGYVTGDFAAYDQSAVPGDLSLGTTSPGTSYTPHRAGPQAILGMTSRRSIGIVGDSRFEGVYDSSASSQYGDVGDISRSIRYYGHVNFGLGNDSTVYWLASHALRRELLAHCSDIVIGFCTNDIAGSGLTGAQILTNTQAIAALFPDARIYATTHYPIAIASTDSFTTLANQSTTNGYNTARNDYNALLRAGVAGIRVWDVASVIESAPGSNKIRVDKGSINADSPFIHLNATGDQWIADSGIVRIPDFGA